MKLYQQLEDPVPPFTPRRRSLLQADCCRWTMIFSLSMLVLWMLATALIGPSLLLGVVNAECTDPCVPGSEEIMNQKDHGTCPQAVQSNLKFGVDWDTTDRICCKNRRYAEYAGYWETTDFPSTIQSLSATDTTLTFYDPVTGLSLFTAPRDRTWADFVTESQRHGWPSFRDSEVDWDNVRVLPDGETVSISGTHLGHNLPDSTGNRYCINLVSVAGYQAEE